MTPPDELESAPRARKTSRRRKLAILAGSLVVSLALGELFVRTFVPIRLVGPSFAIYDDVYGRWLKRNFSAVRITPEFRFRITTNSYRMRGPEPASQPDSSILFLGDSFTFGFGVSDGEEYPGIIRKHFEQRAGAAGAPVVNFAMSNNGNGRWVKFLRDEAERFGPRAVVLQVMDNDFGDNLGERLFELDVDGVLQELPVPGPTKLRRIQPILEAIPGLSYSYLFSLMKQAVGAQRPWREGSEEAGSDKEEVGHPLDRLTYALIRESLVLCQQHGWPVAVGILQVDNDPRRARLEELFTEFQVPVYHPPEKGERPELYWTTDGHWNAQGHEVVAEAVLKMLAEHPAFK